MENKLVKLVTLLGGAMVIFILMVMIFIDRNVDYMCLQTRRVGSNIVLIIIAIVLLLIVVILPQKKNKLKDFINKRYKYIFGCMCVFVFGIQLYIAYCIWFRTGWDVYTITNAAELLANDLKLEGWLEEWLETYFSTYPNNVLLTVFFKYVVTVYQKIGIREIYFVLVELSSIMVFISGILLAFAVKKITKSACSSLFSFVLFIPIGILSPWIVIPYSDTFAMPFIIGTFLIYLYKKESEKKHFYWLGIALTAFFGMLIKPTVIIVFIAIVTMELWHALFCVRDIKKLQNAIIYIAIIGCAFCMTNLLSYIAEQNIGIELHEERNFGMSHFLMMGVNEERGGIYSNEDVEFSNSFATKDERNKANIQVFKERVSDLGIKGLVRLGGKKLLTAYNDGTFAWGGEGEFFKEIKPETGTIFCEELRELFYMDGEKSKMFCTAEQFLWLFILVSIPFVCIGPGKERYSNAVVMLTLIGITLFLLIFEVRARYLYCFLPMFVCAACVGQHQFISWIREQKV